MRNDIEFALSNNFLNEKLISKEMITQSKIPTYNINTAVLSIF